MGSRYQSLLATPKSYWRLPEFVAVTVWLATFSLLVSKYGSPTLKGPNWPEAFVNAAMLHIFCADPDESTSRS